MSQINREITRGANAERILKDDLVKEAFDLIETNIKKAWEGTRADDFEGREECWRMLHAAHNFKRHFTSVMQTGVMAKADKNSKLRTVF